MIKLIINILSSRGVKKILAMCLSVDNDYVWKIWRILSESIPVLLWSKMHQIC